MRVNEILADYLQRLDEGRAETREVFLASHSDFADELRRFFVASDQMETLVVSAGDTLAAPSPGAPKTDSTLFTVRGAPFGDYELLEMIARGGMGIVYKARQRKLNRIVAIKMILAGQFADDTDLKRFYAEAEASAHLRHPNIVSVHEVGEHEGKHFFSMDYIDGESLADLVQEHAVPARRAAELMLTISAAMQYAHEQGILHRDLKPSNVLLDPGGEPLVTDFGLAKQLQDQSQLTVSGTIMGTPSYMPPEQAAGRNEQVDRHSDVYSLGAILYELLTGKPPFRGASAIETVRQVLENDPVAPRMLNPSLPVDLETISLKCLEKEPTKRYATAQEFHDELERYLDGKPILARPVSRLEYVRRWCLRNPVVASLLSLSLVLLIAMLTTFAYAWWRTSLALEDAEYNYQQARSAVDSLFKEVSDNTLLNQHGMQPVRVELLNKALVYYKRFAEQRAEEVSDGLADTHFRIGSISSQVGSASEAMKHYQLAQKMQKNLLAKTPDDLARLTALSETETKIANLLNDVRDPKIESHLEQAIRLRKRLVELQPDNEEFRRKYANSVMNLGLHFRDKREFPEALKRLMESQEIRQQHLNSHKDASRQLRADMGEGFYNLANVYAQSNDAEQTRANYQKSIDVLTKLRGEDSSILDNDRQLAISHTALAVFHGVQWRIASEEENQEEAAAAFEQSLQNYQRALGIASPLARRNPTVHSYQATAATVSESFGVLLRDAGNIDEADELFENSMEIRSRLARDYPHFTDYRHDLRVTSWERIKLAWGRFDLPRIVEQLSALDRYYSEASHTLELQSESSRELLANVDSERMGFLEETRASFTAIRTAMEESGLKDVQTQLALASVKVVLATVARLEGKSAESGALMKVAKTSLERLSESHPDEINVMDCLAYVRTLVTDE